jgi:soluble lytic murein transglycosylase-like protein
VKGNIRKKLRKVARELGLDPRLAVALGEVESGFNPEAVSPKGAIGVLQLMPRFFCKELEIDVCMLYDPDENIRMGLEYLKSLLERFKNDIELSLAAYNSGPRRVVEADYAIPPIEETHSFVKRVREAMEKVSLDSLEGRYALSRGSSMTYEGRLEGNAFYLD